MSAEFWISGRILMGDNRIWEFQGLWDSEGKAVTSCMDASWFVAPVTLNEAVPLETEYFPNAYYPLGWNVK